MTAVLSSAELAGLERAARTRAAWLSALLLALRAGPVDAGATRRADTVPVVPGDQAVVFHRGAFRRGLVLEVADDELVVEYLTANALQSANGTMHRSEIGVDSVSYAAQAAVRARHVAEEKLRRWRRWVTTSPSQFATDAAARRVWRCIEPGHRMGAEGSVAPAAAAMLARQDAADNLARYQRSAWPCSVHKQTFAEAYIRDRVSRLCQQAPHLAHTVVKRATVARRSASVLVGPGGEASAAVGEWDAAGPGDHAV